MHVYCCTCLLHLPSLTQTQTKLAPPPPPPHKPKTCSHKTGSVLVEIEESATASDTGSSTPKQDFLSSTDKAGVPEMSIAPSPCPPASEPASTPAAAVSYPVPAGMATTPGQGGCAEALGGGGGGEGGGGGGERTGSVRREGSGRLQVSTGKTFLCGSCACVCVCLCGCTVITPPPPL